MTTKATETILRKSSRKRKPSSPSEEETQPTKSVQTITKPSSPAPGKFTKILANLTLLSFFLFLGFVGFYLHRFAQIYEASVKSIQNTSTNQNIGTFLAQKSDIKFAHVQGCDEVKAQLEQVVDFLRSPEKYERFGAVIPRGVLLQGPPGVGKTMLAKAVAGEADVPFFSISGSEFEEVFVGVGASRVRALFKTAREHQQAVIFIDEIDAVGGKRTAVDPSFTRQTLNQLLVEMDGFNSKTGIIVLAATNAVEILDPALLRPGRFDRTLSLHLPDINGRTQILTTLLGKVDRDLIAPDLSVESVARLTIGFSGADLSQLVNQAKLFAALDETATKLEMKHLNRAVQFVALGPERKLAMKQEERERTAFHEAGHAVVALATAGAVPVHQATIIPHGLALGLVIQRPDEDLFLTKRTQLQAMIDVTFGGFVAEEMFGGSGEVSLGPASDLAKANSIAREMIKGGFGRRTRFLQPTGENVSEKLKEAIEADVQEILDESKRRVETLLEQEKAAWEAIAEALLQKETLSREEINAIWAEHKK